MTQYIDKSALVAEIEMLQAITMDEDGNFYTQKAQAEYNVLCMLESFLDTLKLKEVDLKKEVTAYMDNEMKFLSDEVGYDTLLTIAKHFFELGLKAQKGEEYDKDSI